jgi:hypothetical protein
MEKSQTSLQSQIACLESKVDMLESELSYLNEILQQCGFPEGIATLKAAAEDLIAESPYPKKANGWESL